MLLNRISKIEGVRVGVLGVGYVGLPLAVKLAKTGFTVIGIDKNQSVIDELEKGKSTIEGISDEKVSEVVKTTRKLTLVKVDSEPEKNSEETLESLTGLDIIIVCVPTPLRSNRGWHPETSLINKAAELICKISKKEERESKLPNERLVVLESTTYPGTTTKFFSKLREQFIAREKNLYLAYSPERTSPGPDSHDEKSDQSTFNIKRIVAGIDEDSKKMVEELYTKIFRKIHPVSNLETAEMTKLVENTFRFVSIGFANEMSRIAKAFDLDIWEIIDAVKTKGFGLDICYPGLIGGHCLPIDPHYLGWAYRNHRSVATFVEIAEKSHQDARRETIELTQKLLSQHGKGLPKSSILFLGVAYKKDVGDIRESGVLDLMKKLFSFGAKISFWDPVWAESEVKEEVKLKFSETEFKQLPKAVADSLKKKSSDDNYFVIPTKLMGSWDELKMRILSSEFDCIVLATAHERFHETYYELVCNENAPPIVDINNTINSWMSSAKLSNDQIQAIREQLNDRTRYMLFGRD